MTLKASYNFFEAPQFLQTSNKKNLDSFRNYETMIIKKIDDLVIKVNDYLKEHLLAEDNIYDLHNETDELIKEASKTVRSIKDTIFGGLFEISL